MKYHIVIHTAEANMNIACPHCHGIEFTEDGHTFKKDSAIADYLFRCTGCGFKGTLSEMKIKYVKNESKKPNGKK
jgi:DNA-directed RNA polymerase subunit RPC12/RpoP